MPCDMGGVVSFCCRCCDYCECCCGDGGLEDDNSDIDIPLPGSQRMNRDPGCAECGPRSGAHKTRSSEEIRKVKKRILYAYSLLYISTS